MICIIIYANTMLQIFIYECVHGLVFVCVRLLKGKRGEATDCFRVCSHAITNSTRSKMTGREMRQTIQTEKSVFIKLLC